METLDHGRLLLSATEDICESDVEVCTDRECVSADVIETGHFLNPGRSRIYRARAGGGVIDRRTERVRARRAGCVERRSSGSTEARSAKDRPKSRGGDKPGVLFDGVTLEREIERGRQGHASLEERPRWHKAGANPARGVRAEMPVQRGWRGDLRSGRPDEPGHEIHGPGDRPRKGGREELNHERREDGSACQSGPPGDGAGPRTAHGRGVPGSFCVLPGENSRGISNPRGDYAGVTPGHTAWAWSSHGS